MELLANVSEDENLAETAEPIKLLFDTIMESCHQSSVMWVAFKRHPDAASIIDQLLLRDPRTSVRRHIRTALTERTSDHRE
jgi:hypothetical protein